MARYCGKECQADAWSEHKKICQRPAKEAQKASQTCKAASEMSVRELKEELKTAGVGTAGMLEKGDLVAAIRARRGN